ncbi:MAG: RNA polymerase sigma factor [Polyangiales bacterium]
MSIPEDELVRAISDGDRVAFQRLVERFGPALYRAACRLVGEGEADDVVQEGLTKAYIALRDGRFTKREGGTLEAWLKRIVVRTALDSLRARKRRRVREVAHETCTPEVASARLALRELEVLLDALPSSQRVALVLKEVEGMSVREIAAAMDCSEGAVEQRLVRGRAALRARRGDDV